MGLLSLEGVQQKNEENKSCRKTLDLKIWFCSFFGTWFIQRSYGTCKNRSNVSMRSEVRCFYGISRLWMVWMCRLFVSSELHFIPNLSDPPRTLQLIIIIYHQFSLVLLLPSSSSQRSAFSKMLLVTRPPCCHLFSCSAPERNRQVSGNWKKTAVFIGFDLRASVVDSSQQQATQFVSASAPGRAAGQLLSVCHNKLPHDHLLLDSAPVFGPLILRWELDKSESCWNKSFRTSKILTLLYQQVSNLLSSQRDISGPRLGALSNDRWLGVYNSYIVSSSVLISLVLVEVIDHLIELFILKASISL